MELCLEVLAVIERPTQLFTARSHAAGARIESA